MKDSNQHPDSNPCPLLKSVSLTSLSQIKIRFKEYLQIGILLNSQIYDNLIIRVRLEHTSVTLLDVDLRKWETAIDLRIGRWLENLKKDIDLRIGRRFEFWKMRHRMKYRCLWRRNRTWIWGLDESYKYHGWLKVTFNNISVIKWQSTWLTITEYLCHKWPQIFSVLSLSQSDPSLIHDLLQGL
jgi:hypothetical protein